MVVHETVKHTLGLETIRLVSSYHPLLLYLLLAGRTRVSSGYCVRTSGPCTSYSLSLFSLSLTIAVGNIFYEKQRPVSSITGNQLVYGALLIKASRRALCPLGCQRNSISLAARKGYKTFAVLLARRENRRKGKFYPPPSAFLYPSIVPIPLLLFLIPIYPVL